MTALNEVPTLSPSTDKRAAQTMIAWLVVWSLAVSAGIHLAIAYQHSVTSYHGRFFIAVGTAQALLALVVGRCCSRRWLWTAIGFSVFVVGTWFAAKASLFAVITGPPAPTGLVDASATVLEGMTIVAALVLLRRGLFPSPAKTNGAAVLALVALPALAIAALADSHGIHGNHLGEQPVQATRPAPAPSVFGDLFEDHHAGPTAHDPGTPPHAH